MAVAAAGWGALGVAVAAAGWGALGVAVAAGGWGALGVAVAKGAVVGVEVASSPQARMSRVRIINAPKGANTLKFLDNFNFIVPPLKLRC